jgi:putative ubiquitin-RnfH superfamily antitoxin RatB of RatAB toxin-antitoxin module
VPAERLAVEVGYCPRPGACEVVPLQMQAPATVAEALNASGLVQRHGLLLADLRVGIWGRVLALDTPLRTRDRIEIYRALLVDPKEARRLRYRGQRAAKAR